MSVCISVCISTIRLIELIFSWNNSKSEPCKMHAFLPYAISFALLYSGFVWPNIQALYVQNLSRISFQFFFICFFIFASYRSWETRLDGFLRVFMLKLDCGRMSARLWQVIPLSHLWRQKWIIIQLSISADSKIVFRVSKVMRRRLINETVLTD